MRRASANSLRAKLLSLLANEGPLDTPTIADRMGGEINDMASRLGDMARHGEVERAGTKPPRSSTRRGGRSIVMWGISAAARKRLESEAPRLDLAANKLRWTPAEDRDLLDTIQSGQTAPAAAALLGRSEKAVRARLAVLRDAASIRVAAGRRAPKARKCLCCGNVFQSAHAGNRMCPRCLTQSTSPYAP